MKRPAVLLHLSKKNWYSFVPLINSFDQSPVDADLVLCEDILEGLREACRKYEPVICCMSFFSTQLVHIVRLVERIRSEFGDGVRLVAGGAHASAAPRETLKLGFDVVVRGEGELVFPGVVRGLLTHRPGSRWIPRVVEGIPLPNLDMFPAVSLKHGLTPPIEITRGCLFRCKFCSVPSVFGPVRHRSVESVIETARRLVRLQRRWDFRFISPNSLGYGSRSRTPNEEAVERLLASLRALEEEKRIYFGTFPSEARPDFVTERMVEVVANLADNRTICIGAQSGSDRVLRKIGRGHTLESVYRAAGLIVDAGLRPTIDFILGFPCESESDQLETVEVMRDLVRMGGKVRVHHFIPLPGSVMSTMAPSEIAPEVLEEVGRMALRGKASGAFAEQMKFAREIAESRGRTGISVTKGVADC